MAESEAVLACWESSSASPSPRRVEVSSPALQPTTAPSPARGTSCERRASPQRGEALHEPEAPAPEQAQEPEALTDEGHEPEACVPEAQEPDPPQALRAAPETPRSRGNPKPPLQRRRAKSHRSRRSRSRRRRSHDRRGGPMGRRPARSVRPNSSQDAVPRGGSIQDGGKHRGMDGWTAWSRSRSREGQWQDHGQSGNEREHRHSWRENRADRGEVEGESKWMGRGQYAWQENAAWKHSWKADRHDPAAPERSWSRDNSDWKATENTNAMDEHAWRKHPGWSGASDGSDRSHPGLAECRFGWHSSNLHCPGAYQGGHQFDNPSGMTESPGPGKRRSHKHRPHEHTAHFADEFHPLSQLRLFDLRLSECRVRAIGFAADVERGLFRNLRLSTTQTDKPSLPLSHMQAPHFAFYPNVNSISCSGLSESVSMWDLYDVLSTTKGFITAAVLPLRPGQGHRELLARFGSYSEAQEAAEVDALVKLGVSINLVKTEPVKAKVVPAYMNTAQQLTKDLKLAMRLVQRLDFLAGLTELTFMPPAEGTIEQRLDLLILYLRRVHFFCFYSAQWCMDEWELLSLSGPITLRSSDYGMCSMEDSAGHARADEHEKRLLSFERSAHLRKPFVPTLEDEPVHSRIQELLESRTCRAAEEKFRCEECGKHFRSPDFLWKHFGKVHTAMLEDVRQQVLLEFAQEAHRKADGVFSLAALQECGA